MKDGVYYKGLGHVLIFASVSNFIAILTSSNDQTPKIYIGRLSHKF